jgi:hypothetical protein
VLSANAAQQDGTLDTDRRKRLADQHFARGFAILNSLAKFGYFNSQVSLTRLKTDPDLNPIRHRDDFRDFAKSIGVELPAWALKPKAIRNAVSRAKPTKTQKPAPKLGEKAGGAGNK